MKTKLLSLAALLLFAVAAFPQDETKTEHMKFQGKWAIESAVADGKELPAEVVKVFAMTFKGDAYTVSIGAEKTEGTFTLDPSKNPKTIDIVPDNGPDRGKKQPGIYEIDGDKIKICAA